MLLIYILFGIEAATELTLAGLKQLTLLLFHSTRIRLFLSKLAQLPYLQLQNTSRQVSM